MPETKHKADCWCVECEPRRRAEAVALDLFAALQAIAGIAGNLSDDRIYAVGGINDGRDRAIKLVEARRIARDAITVAEQAGRAAKGATTA